MYRANGKENGKCYILGLYRDYIGITEKKMETTIIEAGFRKVLLELIPVKL